MRYSQSDRRPWYRLDLSVVIERLRQLRTYLYDLFNLDPARLTSDRRPSAKPELLMFEPRFLMDSRPLPAPEIYAGSGAGMSPTVTAYAADTGDVKFSEEVYSDSFTGGVRVASADMNGDGIPDVIVAPQSNGGPNIRIYDGKTGDQLSGPLGSFWAFDPSFDGGVNVAAADVDGDGVPDLIVAAGPGGGPEVKIFSGATGGVIADFFALDPNFRGGITVAAADLTGSGKADLIIGAGPGGGPEVKVIDPLTEQPIAGPLGSFYAFDPSFRGGVTVAGSTLTGDVDGDGTPDVVVGSGPGMTAEMKVYSGASGDVLQDIAPFGSNTDGTTVSLAFIDDDADADLVVGSQAGSLESTVAVFSGATGDQLASPLGEYTPFGSFYGGVNVAAGNDPAVIEVTTFYDTNGDGVEDDDESWAGSIGVSLWLDGSEVASGTTNAFGTYNFSPVLSSTEYQVDATAPGGYTDEGPVSVNSGTDIALAAIGLKPSSPPPPPPSVAITSYSDNDGGDTANGNITNDTKLTLFGTAPDNSVVNVYDNYSAGSAPVFLGTDDATSGGLWSLVYAATFEEGTHNLTAVASDLTSAPYVIIVDTTPPVVNLSVLTVTYDTMPPIAVLASDALPGGVPTNGTVTLNVDLNDDGDFTDPGETNYATATMTNGVANFTNYTPFTPGTMIGVQAEVTDDAGNTTISATALVSIPLLTAVPPPTSPTPTSVSASNSVAMSGNVQASVNIETDLPLPDCGCQDQTLVYNSNNVQPSSGAPPETVQVSLQSNNNAGVPTQVTGTLTWDGSALPSVTYSGANLTPGAVWTFGFTPPESATGRHTFTVDLYVQYASATYDVTASTSGATFVVNLDDSPFGEGWSLTSIDDLVAISATGSYPAGEMYIHGNGQWEFFTQSGGSYISPAGNAGTLTASGGGFLYTYANGAYRTFDSAGDQISWVSPDGTEAMTYTYDGIDPTSITAFNGETATLTYSGDYVSTVVTPGGDVTTLTYSGTDLATVTDPAGGVNTFTYDGNHHLLSAAQGDQVTTYTYANGMAATIATGSGTQTITPAASLGTGSTAYSGSVMGSTTDANGNSTQTAFDALGNPTLVVGPDGATTQYTRDSNGNVTSMTDADGNTTTFAYDSANSVVSETLPDHGLQTFTYQASPHLMTTATDEFNQTTTYAYYSNGDLKTVTDPTGGVTTYTWSTGLVQTVTNPLNETTTYVYDAHDNLLQTLTAGVTTGTVLYDSAGYQAGSIDALGNVTTVVNDAQGDPIKTITPDGDITTTVYDPVSGNVLSSTDPSGVVTSYVYDSAGRQTEVIVGYGSGSPEISTTVYDAAGNAIESIDPLGNITTNTYDGNGRVIAVTDPLGNVTRTQYDLNGNVIATTDALGRVTQYGYDGKGEQITVTDPLGNVTTTVYDANGNAIEMIDPLGKITTSVYDSQNRLIATVDPDGDRSTTVYDANGQAVASIDPNGNITTTVYDATGRVIATEDALGHFTTSTYDADSRVIATTDPLGHTSTTVYNAAGNVIETIDPLGHITTTVYDSAGRVSATIDPDGNRTTTVYDSLGRVSATIDALGERTTSVYDADDRVIATIDPLGNRTTSVYNAAGQTIATIDPLDHITTTAYDAAGEVIAATDPNGNVTHYGYDGDGRQIAVTDPLGNVTTSVYDADSRAIATIDPLGNRSTVVYDAAGREITTIDPLDHATTTSYDAAGNAVAVTDPLNHTTTTVYDADERAIATIDPLGNRSTVVYDAAGETTVSIDALNHRTTSAYDAAGRVIAVTDPLGNTSTTVYDAASNTIATIDPLGNRSTAVYDALNRAIAAIDPDGDRATTVYDADGRVSVMVDANNHRTTFNYDAAGRETSKLDALEDTWQTVYDAAGDAIATVDPLANRTTTVYDADDRAIAVIDPLGNITTTVYDADSRAVVTVDPLGHRTTSVYDAAGRLTASINALDHATTYVYDAAGNRVSLTDADANTTTWVYDADNRMTTETNPLASNQTYVYDAVGELVSTTDRDGRRDDYGYDADGRQTTVKWYASGGSLTQTQTYTYDADGRQLTAQDPDGTYTYTYDGAGRIVHVAEPFGLSLTFGYDAVGNQTSIVDSLGGVTTVVYDARNMQTSERLGGTGVTPIEELRTYDDDGRLSEVTRQEYSMGFYVAIGTTSYTYDADSRETKIVDASGMGSAIASYSYDYDAAGNLKDEWDNGVETTYAYDALGELTSAGTATYSYDANGNRNGPGYSTGKGNQMLNDGTWTYTYDNAGNVSEKSDAAGDLWTYTYDNNNQLVSASYTVHGMGSPTEMVTYVYDAIGNRIESDDWDGTNLTVLRYGMDGWNPAKPSPVGTENFDSWVDLNSSDAEVTRRMFGPGADNVTARESAGGVVGWYLTDHLGSVRGITDGSGTPLTTIAYDAWGSITSDSTPTQADRYGYTGQEWDYVLELWYDRARMRGNETWYSVDPMGFAAGVNPYEYVNNHPVFTVDASGDKSTTGNPSNTLNVTDDSNGLENEEFDDIDSDFYSVSSNDCSILSPYSSAQKKETPTSTVSTPLKLGQIADQMVKDIGKESANNELKNRATLIGDKSIYADIDDLKSEKLRDNYYLAEYATVAKEIGAFYLWGQDVSYPGLKDGTVFQKAVKTVKLYENGKKDPDVKTSSQIEAFHIVDGKTGLDIQTIKMVFDTTKVDRVEIHYDITLGTGQYKGKDVADAGIIEKFHPGDLQGEMIFAAKPTKYTLDVTLDNKGKMTMRGPWSKPGK